MLSKEKLARFSERMGAVCGDSKEASVRAAMSHPQT
jgi:hypothetical protein